jgi:cytochrome c oxidase subunit 4
MRKLHNVTALWLLMMVLTITTYMMGTLGYSGIKVVMFLLLTILIKGTIIIRDFMELRGVSLIWKIIMYGWLGVVTFGIAISFIIDA